MEPVICFGQQPCGIFPKRFLVAKIATARELQQKLGGKIIFFYHDSDHDYRETITVLRDKRTGVVERLNFEQENKLQKKYSPLYLKRIPAGWQAATARRLHRFVDRPLIEAFTAVQAQTVADFCLQLYQKLGLLDNITIVRSSDHAVRSQAIDLPDDYFADVSHEGEVVRARVNGGKLFLHRGGDEYLTLPSQPITKVQMNPNSEQRFAWMQSVVHCTHYVYGQGEGEYLDKEQLAGVTLVARADIPDANLAWIG